MQTSGTHRAEPLPVSNNGARRTLIKASIWATALVLGSASVWAQNGALPKGGAANLAMVGEPQGLDPMVSTADLVGTIMQHVYEPLYTFDANWNIAPMLAESLPTVSKDGLSYTINLRKGVKFHNGRDLTADDVVASLQRWMELSPRGKAVGKEVASLAAKGALTVELKLKNPYAPLLAQLALPSGMAAIMAKDSIAPQLKEFIGTGPYKFKERRPDQFTVLTRFDGYAARKEPASGYAGKREAVLDELRFVPVPSANTRVEGALSGQFQYADLLPVEAMGRIEKGAPAVVPIMTKNFGFPYIVFNTKEGVLANQGLRRAVQTAVGTGELMAAGFGDNRFFTVEPNFFPKGTPYYSEAGSKLYNERNPQVAKEQAAKAGYTADHTVRIMASRQYEFHYNMALVMAEQLKKPASKPTCKWWTGPPWCSAVTTPSSGMCTSPTPACCLSPCSRPRNWAMAHRAGGTLPTRRQHSQPSTRKPTPPSVARCGARCSKWSTTRCLSSKWASSTACRPAPPNWWAIPRRSGLSSGTPA